MKAKRVSLFRKVFCDISILVFRHCLCRLAQLTIRKGAFVHRNGHRHRPRPEAAIRTARPACVATYWVWMDTLHMLVPSSTEVADTVQCSCRFVMTTPRARHRAIRRRRTRKATDEAL